jgi:hypothetical protein
MTFILYSHKDQTSLIAVPTYGGHSKSNTLLLYRVAIHTVHRHIRPASI